MLDYLPESSGGLPLIKALRGYFFNFQLSGILPFGKEKEIYEESGGSHGFSAGSVVVKDENGEVKEEVLEDGRLYKGMSKT